MRLVNSVVMQYLYTMHGILLQATPCFWQLQYCCITTLPYYDIGVCLVHTDCASND
jgi:hypothetical protein